LYSSSIIQISKEGKEIITMKINKIAEEIEKRIEEIECAKVHIWGKELSYLATVREVSAMDRERTTLQNMLECITNR
jgi:hypothetical protein